MLRQTVKSVEEDTQANLERLTTQLCRLQETEGTWATEHEEQVWSYTHAICKLDIKCNERKLEICREYSLDDGMAQPVAPLLALLNGGDETVAQLEREIDDVYEKLHPLQHDLKVSSLEKLQSDTVETVQMALKGMVFFWSAPKTATYAEAQAMLKNTETPEGRTFACFINRFWSVVKKGVHVDDTDCTAYEEHIHSACPHEHLRPYVECGANPRAFVNGMKRHFAATHPHLVETIDMVMEDFLFPQIYSKCMESVARDADDAHLAAQCDKFFNYSQSQFEIEPSLRSPERVPFNLAVAKLKAVYFSLTPFRKLLAVYEVVNLIFAELNKLGNGKPVSTDMFLPVFTYVVVQARMHKIATTVSYITTFMEEEMALGELGFVISSLEMVAAYVKALTADKLSRPEPSPLEGKTFVVADRERYRALALQPNARFSIVEECVELRGFRLFAVREWLYNPAKFMSTVVVHTGDDADVVLCAAMQSKANARQSSFLQSVFFAPTAPGLSAVETPHGTLVVADTASLEGDVHLIDIPTGDFEEHRAALETQITLVRLGCMEEAAEVGLRVPREAEKAFREEYEAHLPHTFVGTEFVVAPSLGTADLARTVVVDIQQALAHFDFFPLMCTIDGVYNSMTLAAVKSFQLDWNKRVEESADRAGRTLRSDGYTDGAVFAALLGELHLYHDKLALMLYEAPDPLFSPEGFSAAIKAFQKSSAVFPDGRMGKKTRTLLDELVAKSHPEWRGA